jgi:hypothetical protein
MASLGALGQQWRLQAIAIPRTSAWEVDGAIVSRLGHWARRAIRECTLGARQPAQWILKRPAYSLRR